MAAGVGDLLDGWANRDIDIDAFGSAVAQHFVPWGPIPRQVHLTVTGSSSDTHDRGALPEMGGHLTVGTRTAPDR
jgi:hypothetical protein